MAPHSEPDDGFPGMGSGDHDGFTTGAPITEIPVLIVGGGPSGLLQAYMLSKLGGLQSLPSLRFGQFQMKLKSSQIAGYRTVSHKTRRTQSPRLVPQIVGTMSAVWTRRESHTAFGNPKK